MVPSMAKMGMAICMASTQYQSSTLSVAIIASMRILMWLMRSTAVVSSMYSCR